MMRDRLAERMVKGDIERERKEYREKKEMRHSHREKK